MVRYTLKGLQHWLQSFKSVSDLFGMLYLYIKGIITELQIFSKDLSPGLNIRSQDFQSCLRRKHLTLRSVTLEAYNFTKRLLTLKLY